MKSLVRLAVAALASFGLVRLLSHAPYWQAVSLSFLGAGVLAAFAREVLSPPPHSLADLLPDVVAPLVLAGLMLLAVHDIAPIRQPDPVLPSMVWPLVDLWRPPGGRKTR